MVLIKLTNSGFAFMRGIELYKQFFREDCTNDALAKADRSRGYGDKRLPRSHTLSKIVF